MEFFKGIGNIKYEGKNAQSPFAFRCYNPDEVIAGKTMREQLRFAMSYWHTMCAEGSDMFGVGTLVKHYDADDPMEIARNKAYAAFELMNKPGIETLLNTNMALEQDNDRYYLVLDVPKNLADASCEPVTTIRLSTPIITEQPYENPDGTPVDFTVDYQGNHRSNIVVPGPFAQLHKGEHAYLVWDANA